jgi:hypothetical protein
VLKKTENGQVARQSKIVVMAWVGTNYLLNEEMSK